MQRQRPSVQRPAPNRARSVGTPGFDPASPGPSPEPNLSVGDELLLNFGPEVARNRIDQSRVTAAVGLSRANVSAQIRYMDRTVVLPSGPLVMNHTAVVWVFHAIDPRRAPESHD